MNPEIHERIRRRAYALWEAAGRVLGKDLEFWLRAEKEVLAKISSMVGKAIVPQTKKVAKSVKPKTATKKTSKPKAPPKSGASKAKT